MFYLPSSVKDKEWDIIIIGGGIAGLSAAIYAAREGAKTLVLEKNFSVGGNIALTNFVENYPGFIGKGQELANIALEQAKKAGATISLGENVVAIDVKNKIVKTSKQEYVGKALILAMGSEPRKLNVPGEKEFVGRGVSYCATCDAQFFKNHIVAVVGGGNSAVQESLFIAKFVKKLYLIHRKDKLKAEKILIERLQKLKNVELVPNANTRAILGEEKVTGIRIVQDGEEKVIPVDGVFIFIGYTPQTKMIEGQLELDEYGYVVTDEKMQTSVKGIFAAGDIRQNVLKQAVTSASEGAIAGFYAAKFVEDLKYQNNE